MLPVLRSSRDQRTALATLTENAFAASRQLAPPRTAATTRSRRSGDRDRVIRCWPPPSQQLESETRPRRNPQIDSVRTNHALAAPIAALLVRRLPGRLLMAVVGAAVSLLALRSLLAALRAGGG